MKIKDLLILGNGMAGMTAALYAKRANLDFKLIGRDAYDFGQIGDAILVDNYPCAPNKSGFDLAMSLHEQLAQNEIEIEEHTIMNVHQCDNTFFVEYEDGGIDKAKTIIYALGARHRELPCKDLIGNINFHYCALCDGSLYKDKKVAVIGGGDSAFTQAEYLSKICKDVIILMCDDNITAAPTTIERIQKIENIHITKSFPITSIVKSKEKYSLGSEHIRGFYIVDGIFVAIGMTPNTQGIITINPLITDTWGYILTDENCKTKCKGFFAAGDVRAKQLRQSITAAADGANAVQSVINYLKEN